MAAVDTQSGIARLAAAFARAKEAGRGALIPYLCAGDPDRETSAAMLAMLGAAGADIVELGIPYGDPLADGPTIAAAAQRSLDAGTTIDGAIALAANAARGGAPPILMFTYFNPVLQFGLDRFADALVAGGICGAIVPDVPLEESAAIREAFAPRGLALPLLIAPTTPEPRARAIAAASEGFVYLVSRLGVTSASQGPDFAWIAERARMLREVTSTPLAIGFGISTAAHVREAHGISDGAIVGSALIDAYAGTSGGEAVERARRAVIALLLALALAGAEPSATAAPEATATPGPADCSIVDVAAASRILGYPVGAPDPNSRTGGSCFYVSRDIAEDGSLAYAIVTPDRLAQRRAFFLAFSRRCAPAAKGTLNELACRQFIALSQANDMDDYYTARSGAGDASPVPGLGDSAVASGNALYVRHGEAVFEVSVLRGGDFDLERSTALARELLSRAKT